MTSTKRKRNELLEIPEESQFVVNKKRKEKPKIEKPQKSGVLLKLQQFLPKIKAANEKLVKDIEEKGADAFDIEKTSENDAQIDLSIVVVPEKEKEQAPVVTRENFKVTPQPKKKVSIVEIDDAT